MRNIRKHNGDSDSNIFSRMVDAFRSLKNGSKANLSDKEKTASADETIESSDVHNNTEEVSLSDTSSDPASSDFSSDPSIYEEFSDVFDTNDDSEHDNYVNDFNSDYSSYNDYSDEFSRDHYAKTNEENVSANDDPDLSDYYSDYIVDGLSDDASDNNDVYTDNPSESSEAAFSAIDPDIDHVSSDRSDPSDNSDSFDKRTDTDSNSYTAAFVGPRAARRMRIQEMEAAEQNNRELTSEQNNEQNKKEIKAEQNKAESKTENVTIAPTSETSEEKPPVAAEKKKSKKKGGVEVVEDDRPLWEKNPEKYRKKKPFFIRLLG